MGEIKKKLFMVATHIVVIALVNKCTVCRRKKLHQFRKSPILHTGITYTVECKKRPKPFPRELVLRKIVKFNLYSNSDDVFFVRVGQKRPLVYFFGKLLTST
jgi:hypothetical protein